jgi:DEAD/DEAH box helicase domain-containing protein
LEALDTELRRQPGAGLRLWLGGEPERWDPPSFAALGLLEIWGGKGRPITLLVLRAALGRLDAAQKRALARLADRARADLAVVQEMPRAGAGHVLAAVESPTRRRIWAAQTPDACVPDDLWGRGTGPLTNAVDPTWEAPAETSLHIEHLLADPRPRMDVLRIGCELDGFVTGFGQRFWDHIRRTRPDLDAAVLHGRLTSAEYDDRYLLSPLAVRLLHELLVPLGRLDDDRPRLRVRTLPASEGRSSPALVGHDWQQQSHRALVMHQALAAAGFTPDLTFGTRRDLPHERALTLTWSDDSVLALSLDQGLGHWRASRSVQFPFTARPERQARELLRSTFTVIARSQHPTIVFVGDLQPDALAR